MLVGKIRKGVLTIPAEIRKKASLEDGALVSIEYNDGVIVLRPKASQEDYVTLSKKGKEMLEEALEAERNGDVIGPFSSIGEALKALKES